MFDVKIDERQLREIVEKNVDAILDKIGYAVASQIEENISIYGPPRSKKGEYPRIDSGKLHASIFYYVQDGELVIGSEAEYAEFVEESRPFISRTWREMESRIKKIVEGS